MKISRCCTALLLGVLLAPTAFAAEQPSPNPEVGTTLIGQRDAAVGLYLLPWKEEAASDIDRPPHHFEAPDAPVDVDRFAARINTDEANAAYRRVRLEPR